MIKQILNAIVIISIAMNLFTNEDKLRTFQSFQNSTYTPIEMVEEEAVEIPTPLDLGFKPFSDTRAFSFPLLETEKGEVSTVKPLPVNNKTSIDAIYEANLNQFTTSNDDKSSNTEPYLTPNVKSETSTAIKSSNKKYKGKTRDDVDRSGKLRSLTINKNEGELYNKLKRGLAGAESSHNPKMITPSGTGGGFGSGAWGKYQFIGKWHADKIKRQTGLSLKQFLTDEAAQDKYFKWHYEKELKPKLLQIRKMGLGKQYSDLELLGALHYRNNSVIPILKKNQANVKINDHPSNPTMDYHMFKVLREAS